MHRALQALLTVAGLAIPGAAAAQAPAANPRDADHAQPGSIVRVVRRSGDHVSQVARGRFQSQTGDTVSMLVDDGTSWRPKTFLLQPGNELQLRTGHKSRVLAGLGIGIASGFLAGAAIGAMSYKPCVSQGFMDCFMAPSSAGENALMGGAALSMVGGLLGTVVGATSGKDIWSPAGRPAAARLTLAPARGGVAAGIHLEF